MKTTRKTAALPARLERARERFERWRSERQPGARIPRSLWASAAKLAKVYGVYRTARALRLDYTGLKRRAAATGGEKTPRPKAAAPAFFEMLGAGAVLVPECLVELEDASGAKMRLELKGVDAVQLGALARSFLGGAT